MSFQLFGNDIFNVKDRVFFFFFFKRRQIFEVASQVLSFRIGNEFGAVLP